MQQEGSIRYEIIIPEMFDAEFGGGRIPDNVIEKYRLELLETFSGITQYESVTGYWEKSVDLRGEINRAITINAEKHLDPIYRVILEDIIKRMCVDFGQKAIQFTCLTCDTFLIWREDRPPSESPKVDLEPNDRVFIIDKMNRIVNHDVSKKMKCFKLEDGDRVYVVPAKYAKKYKLDMIKSNGRNLP